MCPHRSSSSICFVDCARLPMIRHPSELSVLLLRGVAAPLRTSRRNPMLLERCSTAGGVLAPPPFALPGPCPVPGKWDLESGGSRSSSLRQPRFCWSAALVPLLQSSNKAVVIMPPHSSGGEDGCVGESGLVEAVAVWLTVSLDSADRWAETGYSIHSGMPPL